MSLVGVTPHPPPPTSGAPFMQIPMYDLLRKYGGSFIADDIKAGRRKFRLIRPPRFLALHIKRFVKNQFFLEKNPTIVNFPVKNLEIPVSTSGMARSGGE